MKITVSTVTPVYSGEDYLKDFVGELSKLKERWELEDCPLQLVEAIFVDDHSSDNSSSILALQAEIYDWIKIVTLSKNFGQHAATVAGICHTSGDWVATLDEDLQHKPENLEQLFRSQVTNHADVIYANPTLSTHGNSWRDKSSKFVKRILAKLSSTPQILAFNSFRLIRGSIARAAASSSSSQTYLDIAISWFTNSYNSVTLPMHDSRFVSKKTSGYGLLKLIRHARKLIVSSQVDVASTGLIVGVATTISAFVFGCGVVFQRLFYPELINSAGWASIIALVTFLGGIIIVLICLVLEYINVIVVNQLGKPTYFPIDRSLDKYLVIWFENNES